MPTNIQSHVGSFIASFKSTLAEAQSPDDLVGGEIKDVLGLLETLPPLTGLFHETDHAVARFFDAALAGRNNRTSALLKQIRPIIRYAPWRYSYPPREDAPDLGKNIAFAELIGPEAPFHSGTVSLGLTLIGPQTLYPAHQHPAIELYYVVSGTATWTLNGVAQSKPPGSFILHPSNAVHAMQTADSPLLAIYTWSGRDIRTSSFYTQTPTH